MRSKSGIAIGATLAVGVAGAIVGCADIRFERASQKRVARINDLLDRAEAREAQAPERLAESQRLATESIDRHRDWFQRDLQYVDRVWQSEVDRWPGRWARTVAFSRDYLDGDLAHADATIPRLLY